MRANRENAKKSTGPKTVQGKAYVRRNALTHGLLAKSVLFRPDGTPINEDLHQLWDDLHARYGARDVTADLRIQTVIVECWRQQKALDHEVKCSENVGQFSTKYGYMPNLQRYRTASQRALDKNLEVLEKLSLPRSTAEAEKGDHEADASSVEPEDLPHGPKPTKGEKSYSTSEAEEAS